MTDNKLATLIIATLLIGVLLGFPFGFTFNDSLSMRGEQELGGVRGGAQTGFSLIDGESIVIGTTTVAHELEIWNSATGTFKMYGSNTCDIREIDSTLVYFMASTTSSSGWVSSTTNICN